MIKYILFIFFFSFSGFLFGQYLPISNTELGKVKKESRAIQCDKSTNEFDELLQETSNNKDVKDIDRIIIGKSGNVHSVVHPEQRCVFYDEHTNHIIFTHGADSLIYTNALSSNSIVTSYINVEDLDGEEWGNQISLNEEATSHINRYPSGVVYNPNDAENFNETYTVIAGSDYSSTNGYQNYFASAKMDDNNHNEEYIDWQGENDWARSSMTIINDEVYIFGQDFDNIGDYGANQTLKQHIGTTDNPENGFSWEINTVSPDWLINETEGYAYALYTTYSAWKKDGSIGYMWMIGVTNESSQHGVYQPQVYYTTDGGDSWEYIELNLEDNGLLQQYLPAWEDENGNPQTVRPSFLTTDKTYPGVVDYAGKLHLFSNVYGSTKGDVTNPDDGNWVSEEYLGGTIFDFIINTEGLEQIEFVDHVYTEVNDSVFGIVGWNHRLQASKTSDEFNVFAIWSDQDDSDDGKLNFPDLMGFSYCPIFDQNFGSHNLTEGTLYEGFYFFPYISEITPGSYYNYGVVDLLPITTSVTPSEWAANCPLESITHSFVLGVNLDVCIGAVDENKFATSLLSVSQNTPNPVRTTTKIIINSSVIAPVYLEVYNLLGQSIYTKNAGLIYNEMEVELNLADEEPGMYFYTVKTGDNSVTKKLLVE